MGKLLTDNLASVEALVTYAFHKQPTGGMAAFETWYDKSRHYGVVDDDDEVVSHIGVTPLTVNFHGKHWPMAAVGYVASYPEVRGQGAASELMTMMLATEYEAGTKVSYLAPFSYGFYGQFGYAHVFDQNCVTWPADQFPRGEKAPGAVKRLPFDEAVAPMATVHRQAESFTLGSVAREDWWWRYRYADKLVDAQYAIYFDEFEVAQGYVIYGFSGMDFMIHELVGLTSEAIKGLTRFVQSHAGAFERFVYQHAGVISDELRELLMQGEPVATQQVKPFMQARIIDFEGVLRDYPIQEENAEPVALAVTDVSAPWNAGLYEWFPQEQVVQRVETTDLPVISGDIIGFTEWLFGYHRLTNLVFMERLQVTDEEILGDMDRVVPFDKPVNVDYF